MVWNDEQNSIIHIAEQPIATSCRWFMISGQMCLVERINCSAQCGGKVFCVGEEGLARD